MTVDRLLPSQEAEDLIALTRETPTRSWRRASSSTNAMSPRPQGTGVPVGSPPGLTRDGAALRRTSVADAALPVQAAE